MVDLEVNDGDADRGGTNENAEDVPITAATTRPINVADEWCLRLLEDMVIGSCPSQPHELATVVMLDMKRLIYSSHETITKASTESNGHGQMK